MHFIAKKTLEQIVSSGNDFVISIKKNQRKLYEIIEEESSLWKHCQDYLVTKEINRGRYEKRQVYLYEAPLSIMQDWAGARTIIKIRRTRIKGGNKQVKTWYYLSSKVLSAKEFGRGIRQHWHIENKVHWVKDVVFLEDSSTIRDYKASAIMSILSTIVLNLIVKTGATEIKNFMMLISHNIGEILHLIE